MTDHNPWQCGDCGANLEIGFHDTRCPEYLRAITGDGGATTYSDHHTPADFNVGDRVELHPAHDLWMAGARYGEVVKVGRRYLGVKLDTNGKVATLHPVNVGKVAR